MARTLTDTTTIEWDEATSGQQKAHIVAGSVSNTHIASGAAIAVNKLAALTASRLLVSDGSGFASASSVSATEAGYLSGVTSAIQTQLNAKLTAASNLSDVANAGTARTNLGLAIGSNVQAYDADLDALAALSPSNDDIVQRKSGAWTNRTMSQLKTDLGVVDTASNVGDSGVGIFYQKTSLDLEFRKLDSAGSPITIELAEMPNKTILIGFDAGADLDNNARVGVRKNSTGSTHERRRLNFIEGSNVTITVSDDGTDEEVDITIAASGGGGGGATTALDNLASVAVNTSIISDTDNTDDLGSSSIRWKEGHFVKALASTFQSPGTITINAQGANTLFSGDLAGGGYSTLMSFQGGVLTLQGKVQAKSGYGTLSGDSRLETLAASDSEVAFVANSAASPTVDVAQFRVNGTKKVAINKRGNLVSTQYTPSSASDTGETGEIAVDDNYIYVATGTNTWKRVAIATW